MHPFGDLGPNAPLIGQQGSRSVLSTPALVLDLDRFERNIAYLADYLGDAGHGLRPVAKIHKSVEIAKRHLLPKAVRDHALQPKEFSVSVGALRAIIRTLSHSVT